MNYPSRRTGKFIGVFWVLLGCLVLGVVFSMTSHRLERLFVYYPLQKLEGDPSEFGLSYQELIIPTEDRLKLHGWFVPCEGASRTLMIFHGNGGNISHRLSWIRQLHDLGVNVLIFDYRGYGRSEGKPYEEGLYRDARAAYQWWEVKRRPGGEQLILMGESLGGAVAVHLAARVPVAGLILQSTFTSARDMAKTMFPIGLLLPLTGVRFDSAKNILQTSCPKLIIHGTRDEVVPFRLGQALYDIAPDPKSFYVVPESGHNNLLLIAGIEYTRQLKSFLSSIR